MNIDGVDASVSGIKEVPVPGDWASLTVPGEVGGGARRRAKAANWSSERFKKG